MAVAAFLAAPLTGGAKTASGDGTALAAFLDRDVEAAAFLVGAFSSSFSSDSADMAEVAFLAAPLTGGARTASGDGGTDDAGAAFLERDVDEADFFAGGCSSSSGSGFCFRFLLPTCAFKSTLKQILFSYCIQTRPGSRSSVYVLVCISSPIEKLPCCLWQL